MTSTMKSPAQNLSFIGGDRRDRAHTAASLEPFDPIAQLIVRLGARREEVARQLDDLAADAPGVPVRTGNHLADHAQDEQQWQHIAALRDILIREQQEIEHALRRAALGTYGRCEACGREIPARRLQAVPAAVYCITCQERHEARQAAQ